MMNRVSGVAAAPQLLTPFASREAAAPRPIPDEAAAMKAARNAAPASADGEPTDPSKTYAMDGEPTDPDVVGGTRGRFSAVA